MRIYQKFTRDGGHGKRRAISDFAARDRAVQTPKYTPVVGSEDSGRQRISFTSVGVGGYAPIFFVAEIRYLC